MRATFRALSSRGYGVFLFATLFANLGLAVQEVAQGWVVHELTGSAAWLGVVAACARVPFILIAPIGGVYADRYNRRALLGAATVVRMLPPFALAIVVSLGYAQPWHFAAAAVCLGLGNAFAFPTNQALVRELVPKADIPSAVAMQVSQVQLARSLGPLLASLVFAIASVSFGFHVTTITCIPLLVFCFAGLRKKPAASPAKPAPSVWAALRQGFATARSNPTIARLLAGTVGVSLLLMTYPALFPILAKQFGAGASGNAYLGGATGAGAFVGALLMPTLLGKRTWAPILTGAAVVGAGALIALAWAPNLIAACVITGIASTAGTTFVTVTASTLQQTTPQEFLGRILSLNLVALNVGMMLGSLAVGVLAASSLTLAFYVLGGATVVFALVLATKAPQPTS